jgi:hypothetical protein
MIPGLKQATYYLKLLSNYQTTLKFQRIQSIITEKTHHKTVQHDSQRAESCVEKA